MTAPDSSRARSLLFVALVGCISLYLFPYQPEINNPNENVRFYMTAALVDEGSFEIGTIRERWGWTNDAACVERDALGSPSPCVGRPAAGSTRSHYSVKAPGTSYLGVPGYALYRAIAGPELDRARALWFCRLSGTLLPWLVFLYFFHGWLGRRTESGPLRDAVFLTVALGSPLFGYSLMFASHATSAAAGFGAFMLLYDAHRERRSSIARAFLAGLLAAGTSMLEYPCFFVSAILSVYALLTLPPRHRLPFVLGALLPTLAVMHFQQAAFGNAFSPGHLYVESAGLRAQHQPGLFGADRFRWEAALRLLIDRRLGLFALSPLLLGALVGFPRLLRGAGARAEGLAASLICLSLYLFVCHLTLWHGGWTLGPRFLMVLVPFLAWGALEALSPLAETRPALAFGLALGGTLAGMAAAGIPSAYYVHLPPSVHHPLAHLIPVLLKGDYAPFNAGNLVGLHGTASMLPLLLPLAATIILFLTGIRARSTLRATIATTLATAVICLIPHMITGELERPEANAIDFITDHWTPAPPDDTTLAPF